jgi:transposase
MIGLGRSVRVFAYAQPVDMRKGFNGLAVLVAQELGQELLRGDVYLFVGRSLRRAKALYFDGTGLCLLSKRLEKGRFARLWGRAEGEPVEMTLSELGLYLEGSELLAKKRLAPPKLEQKDLAVSFSI